MASNAYRVEWTVWKDGAPQYTTKVHLIDHPYSSHTLCGKPIGWDSNRGYGYGCRRCSTIAAKRKLEVSHGD